MQPRLEIVHQAASAHTHTPPLLFIHGSWHGAWCWEEYFLPFFVAHGFDVTAFSLRGHGRSDGRHDLASFRLSDYADDVQMVVQQCSRPPILIAHSFGGLVAQKYLSIYGSSSIEGLFLMASLPPEGIRKLFLQTIFVRHPFRSVQLLVLGHGKKVLANPVFTRKVFFSKSSSLDTIQRYASMMQDESWKLHLSLLKPNVRIRKALCSIPIGVMGSEYDYVIRRSVISSIGRSFSVEPIFVPTGHDIMIDRNWIIAARIILQWIERIKYGKNNTK
jgi:pimeloyl-ACP methyl ester carboxylesterase